jgi:15-cis-phytoene desaturase
MGSEKLRPTQKTSIQGLVLAGDYTKQNHLATMEGAVVAGHKAAALLIGDPA